MLMWGYMCVCSRPCRFWKTGFWKQHLGDKPYHISALYLIDLVRFRWGQREGRGEGPNSAPLGVLAYYSSCVVGAPGS